MMKSDRHYWLAYFAALALVFFLAGCSGSTPAPAPVQTPASYPDAYPSTPQWTMGDGTYAVFDYVSFGASGTYDPATGMVTHDPAAEVLISSGGRQTNLAYHMSADPTQKATARVQSNAGYAATSVDPAYALIERQTATLVGEAANPVATLIDPPEPYITVAPVAGETFDTTHYVVPSQGAPFYFTTRYRTIAVDVTFDGFEHATVTTLTENPGDEAGHETAYVWVFSGGELAEEVIAPVGAGGLVPIGTLMRRTGVGKNP